MGVVRKNKEDWASGQLSSHWVWLKRDELGRAGGDVGWSKALRHRTKSAVA